MARIGSGTLYGTLDLLILKTLDDEPLHGLGIARRIERISREILRIEEGALYPALHRLERDGLAEAEWGVSEKNRRAKFYRLTPRGRRDLEKEMDRWVDHVRAVSRVLDLAPQAETPE